jgi:hypothetical protein
MNNPQRARKKRSPTEEAAANAWAAFHGQPPAHEHSPYSSSELELRPWVEHLYRAIMRGELPLEMQQVFERRAWVALLVLLLCSQ